MRLGAQLYDLPSGDDRASCRSGDSPRQGLAGPDHSAVDTAKWRSEVVEWLNALFPGLSMPLETSEEELRARLLDGALLCGILKRFSRSYTGEIISAANRSDNLRKFIAAVEQTGLPSFNASDLEQGSMSAVVCCLWSLKEHLVSDNGEVRDMNSPIRNVNGPMARWRSVERRMEAVRGANMRNVQNTAVFGEDKRDSSREARLQRFLKSPVLSESSTLAVYPGGHKFHEVFQLKQGRYYDIPAAKITAMTKSNSLEHSPTQSLLGVMNGILDESIERKCEEIPHRVACLLRKVVQEIERRISTQADHIRNQNNLIKTREEKYQSRIRVLEKLASSTTDEITQVGMNLVQLPKAERLMSEERSKNDEEYVARLTKEKQKNEQIMSELEKEHIKCVQTISELQQEIEALNMTHKEQLHQIQNAMEKDESGQTFLELQQETCHQMENVSKEKEKTEHEISELEQEIEETRKITSDEQFHQTRDRAKENEKNELTISKLKQEIETIKKAYEVQCRQVEENAKEKEKSEQIISELKQEIEAIKRTYEEQFHQTGDNAKEEKTELIISKLKQEIETTKKSYEEQCRQIEENAKEKERSEQTISELKQEIEAIKRTYEEQFHQTGDNAKKEKTELIISKLKQEIETTKKSYEEQCRQIEDNAKEKEKSEQIFSELKQEIQTIKQTCEQQFQRLGDKVKENDRSELAISKLKQEIQTIKKTYEEQCRLMQENAKEKEKTILEHKQEIEAIKRAYEERCHQVGDKIKEKEKSEQTTLELIQEIANIKKTYEEQCHLMEKKEKEKEESERIILELKKEMETIKKAYEEQSRQLRYKIMEKETSDQTISEINQEIETTKETFQKNIQEMKTESKKKLRDAKSFLAISQRKINELETVLEFKLQIWNKKEHIFHCYIDRQVESVQELRSFTDSIKQEVKITETRWCEEVSSFGKKLKVLTDAVENYHSVLAENRKLYNELQELRGNIRVYCRIRPFLPGENRKQSTVDSSGENGEIGIVNPTKQAKDVRLFKFNKVFGPTATQEEVYLDTQPLVRSVLDGYNVCIFAYGQTGSGKTYTMTGPDMTSEKEWGVNYRALNDLFDISRERSNVYMYEVGVQMVEVYNEQIRDLLASGGSQKKLGVLLNEKATGLAIPDASVLPVKSTSDVMDLMQIGHQNRSVSATSLNERSSRSHSIVTIHIRGIDSKNGSTFRGSLHLVDLAGSERVDRSEVTGDRLKEAQHINKSLAALGDVIFALSQKSSHVPYRNSKLTQVLQSSLGGQAKTLMFVQINPEVTSYSESLSTLKFAERVSGVELGAAKNYKEGKDIRDMMEQVASLKDTIARRDEEIEQLQQIQGPGNISLRCSSSNRSQSPGETTNEDSSEWDGGQTSADPELIGSGDEYAEERASEIWDDVRSVGTEDGSAGALVTKEKLTKTPSRVSSLRAQKTGQIPAARIRSRDTLKSSTSSRRKNRSPSPASSARPPTGAVGKAPVK